MVIDGGVVARGSVFQAVFYEIKVRKSDVSIFMSDETNL